MKRYVSLRANMTTRKRTREEVASENSVSDGEPADEKMMNGACAQCTAEPYPSLCEVRREHDAQRRLDEAPEELGLSLAAHLAIATSSHHHHWC